MFIILGYWKTKETRADISSNNNSWSSKISCRKEKGREHPCTKQKLCCSRYVCDGPTKKTEKEDLRHL